MAKQVSVLTVFVASPCDVDSERDCLEEVIRELNLQWAYSKGMQLELIRWETHAYPGVASDPQAVINEQIGDDYDIFIGLLWKRFGTPTPRAGSGTEEEFNRAFSRHENDSSSLRIMVYFKTASVDLSEINIEELKQIREFQSKLGPKGTLYWEFSDTKQFSSLVRMHLSHCVEDWGKKWGNGLIGKTKDITSLQIVSEDTIDEGFLDLLEIVNINFEQLNEQSTRICESTQTLGLKIRERSSEFDNLGKITGDRDLLIAKRICNTAAENLESYAKVMDAEVPLFVTKLTEGIESYSKAAAMLPDFTSEDSETALQIDIAIQMAAGLQDSMDLAVQSLTEFRQSIANQPRMTTQYNRAKRHAVAILDRLLIEMKSGSDRLAECQKLLSVMRAELPLSSIQLPNVIDVSNSHDGSNPIQMS